MRLFNQQTRKADVAGPAAAGEASRRYRGGEAPAAAAASGPGEEAEDADGNGAPVGLMGTAGAGFTDDDGDGGVSE